MITARSESAQLGNIPETQLPAAAMQQEFCLGAWQVLPQLNRLQQRSGNLTRHLEPRLIRLLCFLAANEHRVLSREELIQELWPRVIVNENSLTRAVSELRKLLQVDGDPVSAYIETIPKKGYRLLLPVEKTVVRAAPANCNQHQTLVGVIADFAGKSGQSVAAAFCLSLALGSWLGYEGLQKAPYSESGLLADEIMETEANYFGGNITLSSVPGIAPRGESYDTPVVSADSSQYAYLHYDQTGSTIFLGIFNDVNEPTAVFSSPDILKNLTWSPLGNSLLFTRQRNMTTAALYATGATHEELYSLNLDSLVVSRLREESVPAEPETMAGLNLT